MGGSKGGGSRGGRTGGGNSNVFSNLKDAEEAVAAAAATFTPAEKAQLMEYTSEDYEENWGYTNKVLRRTKGNPPGEQYTRDLQALDGALEKLPKYKGEVHRGIQLTSSQMDTLLNDYKVGKNITFHEYLSTVAANVPKTSVHLGSVQYRIEAKGKNGAIVGKASRYANEGEIIFKRGTSFKVKNVTKNFHEKRGSSVLIELVEL